MANNNININVTTNADSAGNAFRSLGSSIASSISQANALDRSFKFLDKAFNTGKIDLDQYARLVQALDKEQEELYRSLGNTTKAIKSQGSAASASSAQMSNAAIAAENLTRKQRMAGKSTNKFGMVSQQVGYQVGDFLVQVQSGTNALMAFGQQGTQLAGLLPGLSGAILGVGLSLGTAFLGSQLRAKDLEIDLKKLGSAFMEAMEPIKPLLSAISSALSAVGSAANSVMGFISDNLSRVVTYGLTAATVFGVKLVKGFVLAAVASGKFTKILKAGLIRTGIGAFVVALGEIVYQFTRIVKATGGLGNALSTLGQIAKEVFTSLPLLMEALVYMWSKYAVDIVFDWVVALKDMVKRASGFVNKVVGIFAGAIAAVKEIWLALPDIFVEAFNLALQKVKEGVQAAVNTAVKGINWLRDKVGQDPIIMDDLFEESGEGQTFTAISDAMANAKREFEKATSKDYVPEITNFLDEVILSLQAQSSSLGKAAQSLIKDFQNANPTLQKLIDSLRDLEDAGFDVSDIFKKIEEDSGKAKEAIKDLWKSIGSSLENGLMAMVEGTKSVKDAFKDMARDIIKELYRVLVVQKMVGSFDPTGKTASSGFLGFLGELLGKRASGGTVMPNQPYLVGEKGPELILPQNRGHVMNADLTSKAMSGGESITVVQNFSFQANGDESVKRIIAQAAPSIANMAKQSVMDARRRGGAMKNTFG